MVDVPVKLMHHGRDAGSMLVVCINQPSCLTLYSLQFLAVLEEVGAPSMQQKHTPAIDKPEPYRPGPLLLQCMGSGSVSGCQECCWPWR